MVTTNSGFYGNGLEKPGRSVTFQLGEKSWSLDIGEKTADGKSVYVARADAAEPIAYVVPKSLLGKASKQVNDLRDKSAIQFDKSRATRVDLVIADKPPLECRKEAAGWRLARPVTDEADSDAIKKLLDGIGDLRVDLQEMIGFPKT